MSNAPPVSCLLHCVGSTDSTILADGIGLVRIARDLASFVRMDIIGVEAYPIGEEVDSGPGWSITAVITTSHIAFHTWPETGHIMADIVSCKPFVHDNALSWLGIRFRVSRWHRVVRAGDDD